MMAGCSCCGGDSRVLSIVVFSSFILCFCIIGVCIGIFVLPILSSCAGAATATASPSSASATPTSWLTLVMIFREGKCDIAIKLVLALWRTFIVDEDVICFAEGGWVASQSTCVVVLEIA